MNKQLEYQEFVFVYAKNEKIKVCGLAEAKATEKELLADGWVHTSTLDSCMFLEYMFNECNAKEALELLYGLTENDELPAIPYSLNDIIRIKNDTQ